MAKWTDLKSSSILFFKSYKFPELGPPILTKPKKHLNDCRLAIVTTAGLHLHSDKAFSRNFWASDCSYRTIPVEARLKDLSISHHSGEFDKTGIRKDLNTVYPIDRVLELVSQGKVGSVARHHYSFMGSIANPEMITNHYAPELAERLKDEEVDLVLLTPV